jgi:transposase-like protein
VSARREYSKETKAAVMGALLMGQSVSAVAREYDIPKATVSNWKSRDVEPLLEGGLKNETQKRSVGDLITEYVEET